MENVFAFDVDGTLTAPRQRIDQEFEQFFRAFVAMHPVYLVTGSDYSKICEQLPTDILEACKGVFTCSGAELWQNGKIVYRKTHSFPECLLELVEYFIDNSAYPLRCGTHIEPRPGMLNISSIGREASLEQRQAYHAWDRIARERKSFVDALLLEFPQYEASTGGEISIDIVPRGWTKAVARREIESRQFGCSITFFGDRMGPDGNDKPLADELARFPQHKSIAVNSFQDTWNALVHLANSEAA